MEFRVLGKLEALRDGKPVELGAFRQRALLGLLLTAPNTVFSTDRILDELWGPEGGVDKQSSLWVYVSGLRKALEPGREKRSEGTILLTRPPGYMVAAEAEQVDALRFERMVAEGRGIADVDPALASVVLGEALALWRGRAFEDFTYEPFAQAEIGRLEELRLEAVELRIDADLRRGLARELVSELESLVRQHPLRERLTGQLMLALYRSSRQADALRAYQLLRSRLGEELGLDPSSSLRKLEQQIVTGDPSLDVPTPAKSRPVAEPGPAVRGYELREPLAVSQSEAAYRAYQPAVGREVAISVIRPNIANDPGFIRRFQADAQLVAALEHPHIVPLYDFWREPGAAYVVTPLMRGGTLAELVATGPLEARRAIGIIAQVASAVDAAHRAGVVHGDISAENILLDEHGNAYLSNFGIGAGAGAVAADVDFRGIGTLAAALLGATAEVAAVTDRARRPGGSDAYHNLAEFVSDLEAALSLTRSDAPAAAGAEVATGNPYKGLRAFEAVDASDFFGRERIVERLIARLGSAGSRGRFVAVVGPSGSGKSSAVKAGLLPAIRGGAVPLSGSWFVIEMTPAPHPFEQLEEALLGVAVDPPASLLEQLAGEQGMQRAAQRLLPADGSQLLLVIDQFEELFTQVDPATTSRFITSLVSAVTDESSRIRIVATLRADFYDRPLQHRGLGELLREGTEITTPMSGRELERAISRPAEQRGVTFEPALVAELIREVSDRAGALPLLQYALTELFDSRRHDRITSVAFEELGGLSGALVRRAEGLLASLGDGAFDVARQLFLRLVTFTDSGEHARRRVLQRELDELPVDRQLLRMVLDTFGRHRLLSFDRDPVTRGPTVEISHEALLSEWARLGEWIADARDDLRRHRKLSEAMREWITAGRQDAFLLGGGLLRDLERWAGTTSLRLSETELEFLGASVAERDRVMGEQLQREHRVAVAERRARVRVRQLVAVALVAMLVTALAVFGTVQWRAAVDAKDDVEALLMVDELVSASEGALDEDPELALLLAMRAVGDTVDLGFASEEAVDAVHFALQELGVSFDVGDDTPVALRSGPNGLVGVFALSPAELVAVGRSAVPRTLTESECERFMSRSCPAEVEIPADLPMRGGLAAYAVGDRPRPLAGTTVTISATALNEDDGFVRELAAFTERTGIGVELTPIGAESMASFIPGEPGRRPDLVGYANLMPDWVEERAIDLGGFLDPEQLVSDFGNYLIDIGGMDQVRALPLRIEPKGFVFYPKDEFRAAGYDLPGSWAELLDLSDRIVAAGGTPWCFGFESGFASGWPGTDLIESLVLRVGGPETYDAWVAGEVPFSSPAVIQAGRLADALVSRPGYVRGGTAAISRQSFDLQLDHMLARDPETGESAPECWMHHQAAFALDSVPPHARIGSDVDVFPLPPIEAGEPVPMTGAVAITSALVDRPEVRALLEFIASPMWGRAWAGDPYSGFFSANRRFDASSYSATADASETAVRARIADLTHAALHNDLFRFDASDVMPEAIGSYTDATGVGPFWTGMIDWVDGVRTIEQVFADIDAEWSALRAGGSAAAG